MHERTLNDCHSLNDGRNEISFIRACCVCEENIVCREHLRKTTRFYLSHSIRSLAEASFKGFFSQVEVLAQKFHPLTLRQLFNVRSMLLKYTSVCLQAGKMFDLRAHNELNLFICFFIVPISRQLTQSVLAKRVYVRLLIPTQMASSIGCL